MKSKDWGAVDTLYWLGGALIAVGFGLWSIPAGCIVAGVFCLAGAVLVDLSPGPGRRKGGDHV